MKNQILADIETLLRKDQINTDPDALYDAAADRYKEYAKAKKVLDTPPPLAIVYPDSTAEVQKLLEYCNKNQVNVIPRSGKTATEGGLENW
ncbi:MAG: FAD-binding protein, partial [Treponema sp.]|nr:FAD-binding protein [Treponema sp.]